jgi:hypothetical protein
MGILDEAIREHLELKRQHGADDSELKQLEDQAFGPGDRPGAEGAEGDSPDPAAEAPTAFMAQPEIGDGADPEIDMDAPEPPPRRREPAPGLADIQEPPPEEEPAAEEPGGEPAAEEPGGEPAAEEPEAEPVVEGPDDGPAEEEQPAAEHETVPEPQAEPGSHTTEERHAIADQPTEMYDVEEEFAPTEAPAPPDEDLVGEEIGEARLAPAEPIVPREAAPADEEDEDDDFFDEQRLSDELDQALEAPAEPEPEIKPEPASGKHEVVVDHADEPEAQSDSDEDVLEETPDFLEEAPEDDQLWFEQKPPKDFDFDD